MSVGVAVGVPVVAIVATVSAAAVAGVRVAFVLWVCCFGGVIDIVLWFR